MKILSFTFLIVLTMIWPAWSQGTKPKTLDELVIIHGSRSSEDNYRGRQSGRKSGLVYLIVGEL